MFRNLQHSDGASANGRTIPVGSQRRLAKRLPIGSGSAIGGVLYVLQLVYCTVNCLIRLCWLAVLIQRVFATTSAKCRPVEANLSALASRAACLSPL